MDQQNPNQADVLAKKIIVCPRCQRTYEIDKDTLFISCFCGSRLKPVGYFGKRNPHVKICSSTN
jgi:DNA-directed RNA polymerase subunit RPC12/RpoP